MVWFDVCGCRMNQVAREKKKRLVIIIINTLYYYILKAACKPVSNII